MNHILICFRKSFDFSGRARREEYFVFTLFCICIFFCAQEIDNVNGSPVFTALTILLLLFPSISAFVRRLHDIGKSGLFYWITLIPVLGNFWWLYVACKKGDLDKNKYGNNPKEIKVRI